MILLLLIIIPLAGGLLSWLFGRRNPGPARWVSLIAIASRDRVEAILRNIGNVYDRRVIENIFAVRILDCLQQQTGGIPGKRQHAAWGQHL